MTPLIHGFAVNIAGPADLSDLAELLGFVFSKHEPPAVAAGFPAQKIESLARVFSAKSIQEKLSFVARSDDTDKIIGAVLAHDFGTPPSNDIEPLFIFLKQLLEECIATKSILAGHFLRILVIAVDEDWSRIGIAQNLLKTCILNGTNHGYQTAFTEAASDSSRRVFRKIGFQEQCFVRYGDFIFQNSRPIVSIIHHKGCAVMDMKMP